MTRGESPPCLDPCFPAFWRFSRSLDLFRPCGSWPSPGTLHDGCLFMSAREKLTTLARRFLQPSNSTHRQYEALRAYFVEGLSSAAVAARFGYTPGSLRGLVHQF